MTVVGAKSKLASPKRSSGFHKAWGKVFCSVAQAAPKTPQRHHSRYFHFKAAGVGVLLEVSVNNRRDDRDN
jgi:hypothetical protein